jgi:hypothetical protein
MDSFPETEAYRRVGVGRRGTLLRRSVCGSEANLDVHCPSTRFVIMSHEPKWVGWARELQGIAQIGLHFSESEYDRQRYRRILWIIAGMPPNVTICSACERSGLGWGMAIC